jgi:hypothetical protein
MSNINNFKQSNKLFYKKLKYSFITKKCKKFIKVYLTLPHVLISLIILILSFIALGMSIYYKDSNFISSIFANIFAGLITGLVISIISLVKEMSLYITQYKIKWLEMIHNQCLKFISESKKLYFWKNPNALNSMEKYDKIYDLLCLGNDISVFISQGEYNDIYPFDTYKFSKKSLNFDAIEQQKSNSELRDKILDLNVSTIDSINLKELFQTMEDSIFSLNKNVLEKLKQLEIKNKAINLT